MTRRFQCFCKTSYMFLKYERFSPIFIRTNARNLTCSSLLKNSEKNHSPDADSCVKPFTEKDDNTWVGPPHPVSNLRAHVFPKSEKLSDEEKHFYSKALEIHSWNQQYWENHNKDFEQSKKSYIAKVSKEKKLENNTALTAAEMSHFYKEFLDRNHEKHISYNWAWYRKNFYLLFLAAKANLSKLRRLVRPS